MLHHDVAVQCDTEAHSATLGARSDFSCRREQGASVQGATDHSVTRYRLEATPQREFYRIARLPVRADDRGRTEPHK